ncbi:MAG TPA: hypothetical protein VHX44_12525 [Planctomycetota bacterium]|nr:hypothetical protein [Planctomycetota bacterium]
MSVHDHLRFEPSAVRRGCWIAEPPGARYTVFESVSGFVILFQRVASDATDETSVPHQFRHFFPTYDAAAHACAKHYVLMSGQDLTGA